MKETFERNQIKAILSPAHFSSAFKIENGNDFGTQWDYTLIFNLFGLPSGVVPVTVVEKEETNKYEDRYEDEWTSRIREDLKGAEGLPIGVQISSWLDEDEECLGIMKALDDQVAFKL